MGAATATIIGASLIAGATAYGAEQSAEGRRQAGQAANVQKKRAAGQRKRAEEQMKTEEARSDAVKKRGMDKRRQLAGRAKAAPKGGTLLSGAQGAGGQASQTLGDSGKTLLGA